jgi:hypothetical protein
MLDESKGIETLPDLLDNFKKRREYLLLLHNKAETFIKKGIPTVELEIEEDTEP